MKDIYPGSRGASPKAFFAMNGLVCFVAVGPSSRGGLWRTDGTPEGTVLLRDIRPYRQCCVDAWPSQLTNVAGRLFFTAEDETHGEELWTSDGTPDGTRLVIDLEPGDRDSAPEELTAFGGALFFQTWIEVGGLLGWGLWRSDGTEAGTVLVRHLGSRGWPGPSDLTVVGDALFFAASDEAHGRELWRSDGTAAGTVMVADIQPGPEGSGPSPLVSFRGALLFAANDGTHGRELWKSDGTAEGTVLMSDIEPGPAASVSGDFCTTPDVLFLRATNRATGSELWAFGPQPKWPVPETPPRVPPEPNHPPVVTALDAFGSWRTASVSFAIVDPDGDHVRWDVSLSRADGSRHVGSISCAQGCAAISGAGASVSGLVRSGRRVELLYEKVMYSPRPASDFVTLTLTASDGRGGELPPQTLRLEMYEY